MKTVVHSVEEKVRDLVYEKPVLKVLGSIGELTAGTGSGIADGCPGAGQFTPPAC